MNLYKFHPNASYHRYRFRCRYAAVFVCLLILAGCVNEAKIAANGLRQFPSEAILVKARAQNQSYVAISRSRYQLIELLEFDTQSFGKIQLKQGFISDGSTSPLDDDEGSRLAGFIHDALYRGSSYMYFPDGFPGVWSKAQADREYCHQLKRLGASTSRQKLNCRGPKMLPAVVSAWNYHRRPRESYWKYQIALTLQ